MLRSLATAFIALAISASAAHAFNTAAATRPIRLAADPWCPFSCDPQLGFRGLVTDIAYEVLEGASREIKYSMLPWEQAIADARSGELDALLAASKSDAPGFVFPEHPVAYQKTCAYRARAATWNYKDVSSFSGKKIGVIAGYKYGKPFDTFAAENPQNIVALTGLNVAPRLFALLKEKKIDIVMEDERVVGFLKTQPNEPLKGVDAVSAGCLEPVPLYVAFSPRFRSSRELAKIFDRGFEKLRDSPRMKEILDRYSPRAPSATNP